MTPKFRGNSDDWLDDEHSSKRKMRKPSVKIPPRPEKILPPNATVTEVFPKQCRVRLWEEPSKEFLCTYRWASVVKGTPLTDREKNQRERSPLAVGDHIHVTLTSPQSGVIESVSARRNFLARNAPGRSTPEKNTSDEKKIRHVIAANVDLLVIVASVAQPEFSPGLVDRYLIAATSAGIPVCICISKIDLAKSNAPKPWSLYHDLGYELYEVSAKLNTGIENFRAKINQGVVVFCGHSGVGKTSLLNVLTGTHERKIGQVNDFTGKGKHTTSSAIMLKSGWIDTPGIREFGLFDLQPEELKNYFPELNLNPCGNPSCLHLNEENCVARVMPRYSSYRRILESLFAGEG